MRWAILVSACVLVATSAPWLHGLLLEGSTPERAWYTGLGFLGGDEASYLSWMREAADGHFCYRNRFTTPEQPEGIPHLLFSTLGWLAGASGVAPMLLYQAARVAFGALFLFLLWRFLRRLLPQPFARKSAFLCVCLSSGLGWALAGLRFSHWLLPADLNQAEAITYPSLMTNPLFAAALCLMLGAIMSLHEALATGRWRPVAVAAACSLVLGNIHPFDVLTVFAVMGIFLAARAIAARAFPLRGLLQLGAAGAPALLSIGQIYLWVRKDPVFAELSRTPMESPPFWGYLLCFGLPLGMAVLAAFRFLRATEEDRDAAPGWSREAVLFLTLWMVVNLGLAFAPVAFQRRLIMGAHIPIAILAGGWLAAKLSANAGWRRTAALSAALLLLGASNIAFQHQRHHAYYERASGRYFRFHIRAGERKALAWIEQHAPADAAVQPLPWIGFKDDGAYYMLDLTLAGLAPSLTGRAVHAGGWWMTPRGMERLADWVRFQLPETPGEWRRELLRDSGVRYVVFSQKHDETARPDLEARVLEMFRTSPPPCLRRIPEASNEDADVYEVVDDGAQSP